ncbi:MAG: CoA-binding protein [Myxococcales bacterium]|nr:CoA-binding protein [Myxococcales bacterium]
MAELTRPTQTAAVLESARVIAVLGAHASTWKPAHDVPAYLAEQGYRILPVNPKFAGRELFGQVVVATLSDVTEPVDILNVFRCAAEIPGHVDEILAMTPRPRVVWLQLGIRHDEAVRTLMDHGIVVVQDRCTLADHRSAGLPPVSGQPSTAP